jgi:hypothetical protein
LLHAQQDALTQYKNLLCIGKEFSLKYKDKGRLEAEQVRLLRSPIIGHALRQRMRNGKIEVQFGDVEHITAYSEA